MCVTDISLVKKKRSAVLDILLTIIVCHRRLCFKAHSNTRQEKGLTHTDTEPEFPLNCRGHLGAQDYEKADVCGHSHWGR